MKIIYMMTTAQYMINSGMKTPEDMNELLEGFNLVSVGDIQYFIK